MNANRTIVIIPFFSCLLTAALFSLPRIARAQDDEAVSDDSGAESGDEEAEEEAESESDGAAGVSTGDSGTVHTEVSVDNTSAEEDVASEESDDKDIKAEADALFSAIGVKRLTAASYPSPKVRGIKGGSLIQTSHGLQYPQIKGTGIGLSGYIWIDTGYEKIDRSDDDNQPNTKYILQEGRFLLRVTPTFTKGRWFIQGQGELVANKDQDVTQPAVVDADDIWGKVGIWDLFDIQVGRFEAWELYHLGMGMDINTLERRGATESSVSDFTVPDLYGVTFAYYRPSGVGNVAAHFYPTDFFRFELLGQLGSQASLNTGAFRGAGVLDFGFVKIKGGGEYIKQKSGKEQPDERDDRGVGGSVQFVIDPYIEFGAGGAWGITDRINSLGMVDEEGSFITWSAGGFANARIIEDFLIGGGANYTSLVDTHEDETGKVGEFSHLQAFGALQYLLFDQLYIKAVFAWAKAHVDPAFITGSGHDNYMLSGRLRFQYNF